MRIGPLKAEVAAERGRELTDLGELVPVGTPNLGKHVIRSLIVATLFAFRGDRFCTGFSSGLAPQGSGVACTRSLGVAGRRTLPLLECAKMPN